MSGSLPPAQEYRKRLSARQATCDDCKRCIQIVGVLRLVTAIVFLIVLWLVLSLRLFSPWFAVIPVAIFAVLMWIQERLRRQLDRANRGVVFYERGLERIEDKWHGKGNPGEQFLDDAHPYARDLDIFGSSSLFELLCTARTSAGEETLAEWLRRPAARAAIFERQKAAQELRSYIDLREDLSVLGPQVRSAMRPEFMAAWARRQLRLPPNGGRIALCLVLPALASLIAYEFYDGSVWVMLLCVGMEGFFGLVLRKRVQEVIDSLDEPVKELSILGLALQRVEQEKFTSDRLKTLQEVLERKDKRRPSEEIARLVRLFGYLEQRRNQFFGLIAPLLLWSTQFAYAIENWRRRCGPEIEKWLAHFGEFEALCALGGYAYEHLDDPFPEIVEGEALLEGTDLRHPLIPRQACVANTLSLGRGLQLLLVSGSNMSGKSTLLRTVGINTVLALAGGPVRATQMRLCPLAIGATLRVQDSLQAGVSRFYAEIQRLHAIMELTSGSLPVLFLLDEILHGTNSHDRGIGAEAVVRGLVERGALGLVTTHDLVLTRVAESLAPRAANVHFQDHLENGRMTFDYVLHPGVVQKSNALELMRAVGLRV
jgi:hypothetical protein